MQAKHTILIAGIFLFIGMLVITGVFTRAGDVIGGGSESPVTSAQISNEAPAVDSIRISNTAYGNDDFSTGITPALGGTKTVHINGVVSDGNSDVDIGTTSVVFYRTGATSGSSCTADNNDCYRIASCTVDAAAGSGTEAAYDCSVGLAYWVDATGAGGRFSADTWTAFVSVSDMALEIGSSTVTAEVNPLLALNIPNTIAYGNRALDEETTSATNQETILTQKGNVAADVELAGTDMLCSVLGSIPVVNQRWALTDIGYASSSNTLAATSTAAHRNIGYRSDDSVELTKTIYWNIHIPALGVKGTCSGSNVVSIIAVPPEEGTLFDGRLANVRYTSPSYSGYTDSDGNFNYASGETVTFSIGSVTLGAMSTDSINVDQKVFFQDILGLDRSNVTDDGLLKRVRFVQSLATDPASTTRLVIPENAYTALTTSIDFNTVSDAQLEAKVQLVHAERTLVSEADAQEHLVTVLGNEGVVTNTAPVVTTPTSASVTSSSAVLGGTVASNGGRILTARGTCWGTTVNPTTNCVAGSGTSTGVFTHARTALPGATVIHYRAYATNSVGTSYSADATFTTLADTPTVTSPTATSITDSTVTLGGTVSSDGGATITERGTCWGTSPSPTTNCVAAAGTSTGTFTNARTGLSRATFIYYRAYATNSIGTSYSADATFTTLALAPTVTTPTSASVSSSGATLGGTVTDDGGAVITARGTCWDVVPTPTSNCAAASGTSTGVFTHARTGMPNGTFIYYRAYATNSIGTSYSSGGTFTTTAVAPTVTTPTSASVSTSSVILGGTISSDGGAVITARGTCYGTSPSPVTNCVAASGTSTGVFTQSRTGLSLATVYYYRAYATNSVGTTYSADGTFTTLAMAPTVTSPTATAVSTTSATLGGTITSDGGAVITARGTCYGTSVNPTTNCVAVSGTSTGTFTQVRSGFSTSNTYHYRAYATNSIGTSYSADATFTTLAYTVPTVTSPTATNAYGSGATLGGTITSDGGGGILERGTCWGTSFETLTNCMPASGTSTGAFTHVQTGFDYSSTVYYRAYARNAAGTAYSIATTFNTPAFVCGTEIITYDGFNYNTLTRGSQCWMGENLRAGTMLASASTFPTNNGVVQKWCFDTSAANCTADGALYSWDEAMGYSTTAGAQGICPTGWHIPTDTEFKTLEMNQGMTQGAADSTGFRGTDQGTRFKVGGSSNMAFQLAGDRRTANDYYGRGSNAYIWTSTQSGSNAYARGLYTTFSTVDRFVDSKNFGFTVRCLKD